MSCVRGLQIRVNLSLWFAQIAVQFTDPEDRLGEFKLQRLFSTFPAGRPGSALLLMRTVVAVIAAAQGIVCLTHGGARLSELLFTCLLLVLCGACLLVGFLTPLASLLAATIVFGHALGWFPMAGSRPFDDRIAAFEWSVMAAAVALLGPGAFSVDAYLFGRQEIVIPPGPRRP